MDGNGTIDVPGFGYKRFKTWREEGIGDVAVGLRYQYLKRESWRLAFTGGAKVPTGHIDDPDNLVDFPPFKTGAFTPFIHLNSDYTGIKNLVINNTIRYYLLLPRKEELRVLDNVNRPLTANKEKVSRDLGDRLEVELSGYYNFSWGLNFFATYKYLYIFKNRISGDRGFAYEEIEKETDSTAHDVKIGLSYNRHSIEKRDFSYP